MSIHNLSCFEIENASALRMNYRLVNLDGPFDPNLGDGDMSPLPPAPGKILCRGVIRQLCFGK